MSRWFVPRLEGLETRQVLDAALPVPAPVPPSAALVGLANSLPPPDSLPAVDLLPGVVLHDIPNTLSASADSTAPPADALPSGEMAGALNTPKDGAGRSAGPGPLNADKKLEFTASNLDLPNSAGGATPAAGRKDDVLTSSGDGLSGKLTLGGLSRGRLREPRGLGKGRPPGLPEAPPPQAAPRELPLDAPRYTDPVSLRTDLRAGGAGNRAPARGDALRPLMLAQAGASPAAVVERAAGAGVPLGDRGSLPATVFTKGITAGLVPSLWLADLLTRPWQWRAARASASISGPMLAGEVLGRGGGETFLPPLYLSLLPLPVGKPLDPVAEGYLYLCNYARTAIHAAQRRAGPLSDHEDIVQQICLEWLQQAGPPQEAFPRLLARSTAEMQLLRETVNRVIARVIYQQRKGRRLADLVDWPAPARSAERDWLEFQSDCAQGVGRLSALEWQVLELRRQGKTFAEIGTDLGVARQRVWEVYHEVEARLRKIYATADG